MSVRPRLLAAAILVMLLGLAGVAWAQPDPLLGQQWHLLPREIEPASANVRDVWPTTRGAGVVIGIVDDGVQVTHPDLQPNVNLALSTGFTLGISPNPPMPIQCNPALLGSVLGEGCRGTAVAGIAAARSENGIGVSGAAPRASLAGLRLLNPGSTGFFTSANASSVVELSPANDALLAAAIAFRNDAIHVKNFSFGPPDDGATLLGPGPMTEDALVLAWSSGRGGRGTVMVWAAGDGGELDNCNFDGFANSRFVIAVGAVGDDGLPAPYSERCSALFVVAPSSGGIRSITTTDLVGEAGFDPAGSAYTDRFGGTGAAAPTVSGVVALMLSVRPTLTARDIKHILVQSSTRTEIGDAGWTPIMSSHHEAFGFGLVDARAAVTAAATWTSVPPEVEIANVDSGVLNLPIPDGSSAGVSHTITLPDTTSPSATIEHIEVIVDIVHERRGDLEITLTSPDGIVSHLATPRPFDTNADFPQWRFGTVRHWGFTALGGEVAEPGEWTLRVTDRVSGAPVGALLGWTLRIYGTAAGPGLHVAGRVTTPDGAPLPGVTMTFTTLPAGGPVPPPVQTDAAGRWAQSGFSPVPVGYAVTPSKAGFVFAPDFHGFASTPESSRNDFDFVGTPGCGATAITPGQTITGMLAVTDCRSSQRPLSFADRFTFAGTAGQQVAITMSSTAIDTYLYLLRGNASSSTVLAFNDDSGTTLNSRIPATSGFLTLPATETYTLEATSFATNATGTYTVTLTAGSGFSVSGNVSASGVGLVGVTLTFTRVGGGAAPASVQTDGAGNWSQTGFTPGSYTVSAARNGFAFSPSSRPFDGPRTDLSFAGTPADVDCRGTTITLGQTVTGALTTGDCPSLRPGAFADRYTFTGSVAQQISIAMNSTGFDTFLFLIGPGGGAPIAVNDDSGGTANSRIPITSGLLTLPAAGVYTIEATSFAPGATGSYTIVLTSPATAGFSVAGRVTTTVFGTPRGLPGVTMTFARESGTGTVPLPVRTDAAGNWSQSGFLAGTYRVTPSLTSYTYAPVLRTFSNASATLDFAATAVPCVPTPILVGQTVAGSLGATDCASDSAQRVGAFADQYTFQGVAGQQIAISMSSTAFDTFLFIGGSYTIPGGGGGFLAAINDDSGGTLNSRIPANSGFLTLPGNGTFVIEATSFASGATGAYTLSVASPDGFSVSGRVTSGGVGVPGVAMGFTSVAGTAPVPGAVKTDANGHWTQGGFRSDTTYRVVPVRPGFSFAPASRDFGGAHGALDFRGCATVPIAFNQTVTVSGALAATDCLATQRPQSFADRYAFTVPAGGGQVAIAMSSTALDTYLYLRTSGGTLVAENDDSGGTRSARLPLNNGVLPLPAGNYVIEATSFAGGATGGYTLIVASPPPNAFIASGRVTAGGLPQGGVTITFTGGDAGPPPPVVTDAAGFWSQTFAVSMAPYQATATRANFDYAPTPSAPFVSAQSNVNFVGTLSAVNCVTMPIEPGQTRAGMLSADDCPATDRLPSFSDRYTFTLAATSQVVITMTSTTFDTYLYLRGAGGTVLVDENDDAGSGTNSRLVFQGLPAGTYEIQATSYTGATVGSYTLTLGPAPGTFLASGFVTNNGFGMAGVPVTFLKTTPGTAPTPAAVVTDASGFWSQSGFATSAAYRATPSLTGFTFSPPARDFAATTPGLDDLSFAASCPATSIAFGQTRTGTIAATDCRAADNSVISADRYVFEASAGTPVAISMTSTAFDTFLMLYGPSGDVVALNDDSGGTSNSRIPADGGFLELQESGQYVIEASPLAPGGTGAYAVTLSVATDRFAIEGVVFDPDFFTPIPDATITFTRVSGTGPIPAAVRTAANGFWFQTGFAYGTTYRARATASGLTLSPPYYDFASPLSVLDFATSGADCVVSPLSTVSLARSITPSDCRLAFDPLFFYDMYTFTATAGTGVRIQMDTTDFVPGLVLLGPDGHFVTNAFANTVAPVQIPEFGDFVPLPLTGTYVVRAEVAFPTLATGSYTIQLSTGTPSLALAPSEAPPESVHAADAITAQFWTSVGDGAAEGDGISGEATGAGAPAIAVDPVNGEIFMAWASGTSDIHVKKWNGAAWLEVGAGSAADGGISGTGHARFPSIAIKQATLGQPGQPVVAWIDNSSGNWEIYIREFNGLQWVPSGPGTPASGGGISDAGGAIASAEAGRPSLVAERANLFVTYATDQGSAETHRVIVASLRPFTGWAPLAANPDGANVAVAAQEYTAPGYLGARSPAIAINRSDGNPISVYVTGNAASSSNFADIHARRWSPTTWAALGVGAATNTGISGGGPAGSLLVSPRLAVGPDGVPHAAWLADVGGTRSIQVRRFSSSANAWLPVGDPAATGAIFLPTTPGPFGGALSLAIGRDNLPIVAWSAGATGAEIHVRKFSPAAGWHELGPGSAAGGGVSNTAGASRFPALAVDTHNNLNVPIVAWLDSSSGSPQVYVRRAASNADLVVESVTLPGTAAAGQGLDVSVVVRNRGAVAAPPFAVGLLLSTDSTIASGADRLLTVQQVAGGLAAGVQTSFTTRLTLPADVAPGAYFVGAFADLGGVVDEVDEANNGLSGPNPLQVAGPDLIVAELNGPFTATPGQALAVEVQVKNQAQPPGTAAPSRVAVFLSTNPTPGTGVRLGTAQINALAAGGSQTVTPQLMVPGNISAGTYFLAAVADEGAQVAESEESNNGFNSQRTVSIVRPDVVVTRVTAPSSGAAGRPLTATSDVKNLAPAPPAQAVTIGKFPPPQPVIANTAPRFRVNFFLSTSSTAVQPGDALLGGRDVDRLAPGVTSSATTTLTVPPNVSAGTYFLLAVADAGGAVQEGNESNNTRAAPNPITIRQPDLLVTEVKGPVSGVGAAGRPLTVSVKVKNQALAPAGAGPFRVGIYLSLDPTPGTGDFIGFIPVTGLAPGATTARLSGTVTVPAALLDNTYFLSAVADWDDRVTESDEDNNGLTAAGQVTIGRADLILTRVSGPATNVGAAGQPLAVTLGMKNQGPVPASAGPFRVALYLSLSDDPGTGALIGNVSVTGVAPGATVTLPATVVVPASLAAGTYFLSAVADFLDAVAESDELNNGLTATAQVAIRQPDLALTRLSGPASSTGAAGQPLAVTLGVKNQGSPPANAGPFRVGVYLSPNQSPGTGLLIGNVSVTGVVAGALPLTVAGTVLVPASVEAGTYFLSAVADVDNRIGETDEGNNGLTAALPITIGRPDLQVTRVVAGSSVVAGGRPLAVTVDVRNDAPVPAGAGAFRVGVYLSTGSTSDSAPRALIGALDVAGLAAGARTTVTGTVNVPAGPDEGSYFLLAVADFENQVVEADETNNERSTEIAIVRPDLTVLAASGPTTWSPGQPFSVTASVRNLAQAPAASRAFGVGVFLSPVATGGTLVGSTAVTTLASTTAAVTIPVTVPPAIAPGTYNIIVVADHDNAVLEVNETNNAFTVASQVVIRRADLAVTALTGPSTGVRGRTIAVQNTVVNLGNAPATAVRVSFFVSLLDPTPGAGRQVATRDIATLAASGSPAATLAVTTTVTLPATFEPGSYFLSAVVDVAGKVAEGVENNNGITAPGQILVTAQ